MKKLIKSIRMGVLLLAGGLLFAACGHGDDNDGKYLFYYVNNEEDVLESFAYEPEGDDTETMLAQVDEKLTSKDKDGNPYYPEDVQLLEHSLEEYVLTLNFSESYHNMDRVQEILCRAAIVKNYLQIEDIHYVLFKVNGEDLTKTDGSAVGLMNESSFLDSYGKDIMSYQYTKLKLYFADSSGSSLVPEERSVYYSSNSSVEKVIVEQLIQGPQEGDHQEVISSQTGILSVSIANEIAYINLDKHFLIDPVSVDPEVTIYSIVNSVIEAGNVKRVQISVNGDYKQTYRDEISLNQFFELRKDLEADS